MFEARHGANGEILLIGRLDLSQVEALREALKAVETSCELNFSGVDYISSACLGVLLGLQRRLVEKGQTLTLTQMSRHMRELFTIAGFSQVFVIK
ncbi:MAG TPA: STAS domain-containing protein [Candidatus Krumholzibacteria bacterium]|nr:STAS domain-containing protein [Candidatus Krumholzibacteria bacterium]